MLEEFLEVAKRPKFRRFFSPEHIEAILETIDEYAELVKVSAQIDICRDPKDNFLLSLAIDGNADYLLTGDKDLLDINKLGHTQIMTISEFLQYR